MKLSRSALFWIFIWSIFMGVTAISIGFGAAFPSMNRIAKPFVCPRGEMELETQTYRPYPGQTVTTLTWYCADSETGERTELGIFPMSLYAGVIYGLLLFVVIVVGWSLYQRWEALPKTEESLKWAGWIRNGLIAAFVIGMLALGLMPLFNSDSTPQGTTTRSTPTSVAIDSTATSIAILFQGMNAGTPIAFTSTEKPLDSWNNIPIMKQATAGQAMSDEIYVFNVPVDSGTIANFYHAELKSLGWELQADRYLGMEFTKGQSTLLIALSPASDLQSWVVKLVLVQ